MQLLRTVPSNGHTLPGLSIKLNSLMIYLVHHSDHHVDTTTNRHHPLESIIRFDAY